MDSIVVMMLPLAKIATLYHWLLVLIVMTTTATLCLRAYKHSFASAKKCFEKSLAYLLVMCVLHFIIPFTTGLIGFGIFVLYALTFFIRVADCVYAIYLSWSNPEAFKQLFNAAKEKSADYFEPL